MGVNNGKKRLADAERPVKDLKLRDRIVNRRARRTANQDWRYRGRDSRLLHQLANEEVMKATAEKNIVKYTSALETNCAALVEVEKEFEELKAQLAEVAQYLENLKEKVEAAQTTQESSKDDLDSLKHQLQEQHEEIDEFRKKEHGGDSRRTGGEGDGGGEIEFEEFVLDVSADARLPHTLGMSHAYWDLIETGTLSGEDPTSLCSLIEQRKHFPNRMFLQDRDKVAFTACKAGMSKEKAAEMARRKEERQLRIEKLKEQKKITAAAGKV
ncbi:hypothetical protein BDR03DRAFT_1016168 [Suillus americanus]|nr:hypothetical protein BDR03DRAFT_1016168 [Suillus americanus]